MKSLKLDGRVKCVCDDVLNYVENVSKAQPDDEKEEKLPDEITSSPYYLGEKVEKTSKKARALVLDPPRRGCDKAVLDGAISAKIDKIVYVSCNPATQARDLALLDSQYKIMRVRPVDMFPHTQHVENVVMLERRA